MLHSLVRYTTITGISGDIVRARLPRVGRGGEPAIRNGDLAVIRDPGGASSLAQAIVLEGDLVSLQVFSGTKGISTAATVTVLGHPMRVTYSRNILGRVFSGAGRPIDGGPPLSLDPEIDIGGPPVNPLRRELASEMIRTDVPMIDVFNCLVESQKIPIFSLPGEPYNELLARIGIQADAEVVVFAGLGLIFDELYAFRRAFENAGVLPRTVMFVNQASDPTVERLLVPDMALSVAEKFAAEEGKRVLVLMSDMTAFADALREIGIATDRIPSQRGYIGDLYSQLARRYEKACNFAGAGSVTILTVTTMPGDDITHPVPDNTGYITEGQFYLKNGMIDPFGSLSRLKQHVIGTSTREDHAQVMNALIRFYAAAVDAEEKQAMAFDLSDYDQRLLRFGALFRERFMAFRVSIGLEDALDLGWRTMAECFEPDELLIRQDLVERYLPRLGQEGGPT